LPSIQMSLSKIAPPMGKKRRIESESGDNMSNRFPFLALPNELKSHVFSFLSLKDRLRARVNKILYSLEAESTYFVEELCINEVSFFPVLISNSQLKEKISFLDENKSYSSDFFKKISQNTTIRSLEIILSGSGEFHREICSIIKDFNLEE
ncbi:hypothetical protein PENTCL1PPCAC_3499, partial [Pristionchus entomophagus]